MRRVWKVFFMVVLVLGLPWVCLGTTIYDVQHNETDQGTGEDCYPSFLEGDEVTLTGVVTAVYSDYPDFFLQEADSAWSGVFFYQMDWSNPAVGDSVTIKATVAEYYGMTEMKYTSEWTVHTHDAALPDPIPISTGTLSGGCSVSGEHYEGCLVVVRNVVVTQAADEYGQWFVDDGTGECEIEDNIFHYEPQVGDNIASITGVVTYGYGEYEINPRDISDIDTSGAGPPTITNTTHGPTSPLPSETVTVTAQVTDDGTVSSVALFFSTDGGVSFDSTAMRDDGVDPDQTAGDDIYTGQIGPQPADTVVNYYVWAIDDEDSVATDPEDAPTSTYSYTVRGGLPGDGTGVATISPDSVDLSQTVVETLTVIGSPALQVELATVAVVVPHKWSWSQSASDVSLEGLGFSGATKEVLGDTVTVTGAAVGENNMGQVVIAGLTSPAEATTSTFVVKTAVDGGVLADIESSPQVVVGAVGPEITPIADIQADPSQYEGDEVTVQAVVIIGADILDTRYTRAYIQDESGRGILLFGGRDEDGALSKLIRGNLVRVNGIVEEYDQGYISATTEITDFRITVLDTGQALPDPILLSTGGANDPEWDGTWIQVTGVMQENPYLVGGGYNLTLGDGSGEIVLRIWDSTGIDVSEFSEGDTITSLGVGSIYQTTYQMLPGYQEDIYEGQPVTEGIGFASISPSTVEAADENLTETVTVWSESTYVLTDISVDIPLSWTWNQADTTGVQLSGAGFPDGTTVEISGDRTILVHGAAISATDQGVMAILNLDAPEIGEISTFRVKTATAAEVLKEIANSPQVVVKGLEKAVLVVEPRVFVPNRQSYSNEDGFLIQFKVPTNSDLVLRLFDIEGRLVRTLLDEEQYAGPGQVVWNGRDELREVVPVGVYICHLEATDRDKGTTTTDQAPIVVGMSLD